MSQIQTSIRETKFQEERLEEMKKITGQMEDVNAITKELHKLVHDQGQVVDDIEAHIGETEAQVADGVEQLEQAATSAKSGRKWKMIGAVLLIVLIIVLLITFWSYIKAIIPGL